MSNFEENNQVAIYLVKSDLDEMEEELSALNLKFPDLETENEEGFAKSMEALQVVRSLCVEEERLKQETMRLVAKRMQLKRENEELAQCLQTALSARTEMENALEQKYRDIKDKITKYEDSLRAKAERFRKTRVNYNEEHMSNETNKVKAMNVELEAKVCQQQSVVAELRRKLAEMKPNVPEDLLDIVGQKELAEQIKSLTDKCEALQGKRDELLKNGGISAPPGNNKYKKH